jgi:hypothetical protein
LTLCAALTVLGSTPALAQQGDSVRTQGQPAFTPSVAFMGSVGSNPERVAGESTRANYFAAAGELPFQVRSPRWTFNLTYRPIYQYYREDDELTTFDHSGSFALSGTLSPRTKLVIEGDAYASNELRGLDATDVVLPRSRRIRGGMEAQLTHQLSARDSVTFQGGYERLAFPNSELVNSDSVDFGVSYGRGLSSRFSLSLSGRGRLGNFELGNRSRSVSATIGGIYQLAERTEVEFDGGPLWVQEDNGTGWEAASQPGFTAQVSLRHALDRVALRLRAIRDMGTTSGLGQATLRDRITGSLGWSSNRWGLVGLAGYARNQAFVPEGAFVPAVKTLSACGQGTVRISRAVAVVGTALYAHQLGELAGTQPQTDTFRVSLGVRLQANGLPMSVAGSQYNFSSIGRSARAAC